MSRVALQRSMSLLARSQCRTFLVVASSVGVRHASSLPTVVDPAFWKSLFPKGLRSRSAKEKSTPRSKEWNPATFFIVIFLLIGSMSIHMIALKTSFANFMRQADVRIGLLREVVEKIQKGEKVDVEKLLGTGDPQREIEWQEVLNEIEREDLSKDRKKKQPDRAPLLKAEPSQKLDKPAFTVQRNADNRASFF